MSEAKGPGKFTAAETKAPPHQAEEEVEGQADLRLNLSSLPCCLPQWAVDYVMSPPLLQALSHARQSRLLRPNRL
jgi:hypothetical protein